MLTNIRTGFPAGLSFIFEFGSESEARAFFACDCATALKTLERWGCELAIARVEGQNDISIPMATLKLMAEFKPLVQLFFADTSLPALVLKAAVVKMEEESRFGIVRLRDGLQVLMSSGMSGVLLAGVSLDVTTTWKRSEFWNLPQLETFNREWRRSLNEDGSNSMAYRYQIRKPRSQDNWEWYRSDYRLLRGEDGGLYQVGTFLERG